MPRANSQSGEPSQFLSTVWSRLKLAAERDPEAQAALYRQYRRPVLRFLERRVARGVDAELLADEAERLDFDRLYAKEVIRLARERLEEQAKARGSPEARVLALFYEEDKTQQEIADEMSLSVAAVNTHLHRARERLGGYLRDVLVPLTSTKEEMEGEMRHVLGILGRRGRKG